MSKKLLLADDSVTIQRVIELTFSGEDIQVLPVGDGEAAITRIPIDKPDIVLADIGMPKRSGYEVCAFVKNHPDFKNIPVLLLAGAFEPVDDAKAKEVGCDGVLVKPFEPQHVIARVRELIGGATGSPTQSAVQDILRPAARLAPPRPVELPKREGRAEMPEDLMQAVESELEPRIETMDEPHEGRATSTIVLDESLDDYFDKLDEAFGNVGGPAAEGAAARGETHSPRPDRPVFEHELESFDDPVLVGDTSSELVNAPRETDADPFAGMTELEPDEEIAIPTLDDLLGGMDTSPHQDVTDATPPGVSFEPPPPSPMIFDPPPSASSPVPMPLEVEPAPMILEALPAPAIDLPLQPPPAAVAPWMAVAPPAIEPPDVTPVLSPAPESAPAPAPVAAVPVTPVAAVAPAPAEPPSPQAPVAPPAPIAPPARVQTISGRSIIADAFSALFAAEQGESSASMVRLSGGNGSAAPVVTDAMVDDVARRVIEKLALGSSDQMSVMVRQIVTEVSERLVREEIERIRTSRP